MSSSRTIAWIVWIVASIFYAYQYILRVLPSIMLDEIMQQFGIGAMAFGQFSGIYYIGYSLAHLPIGIMLDRFGPKKVMTTSIVLTVIGLLPLIYASHWIYPLFGRLLIGIGSSAAILGVFKIIRMTFDEKQFPRFLSISVMIGLIGAIYGGGPLSYMRDTLGFQPVIEIFAISGLILAAFTYWIVPDIKETPKEAVLDEIKSVLSNKKVLACCFFAGLMVGPLEGFADVWGTTFLENAYGFNGVMAASLPSMIFVGMCFGSPLLNYIAEKIGNYITTVIIAGILMSLVFISMLSFQIPPQMLSINFMIVGICSAYQILAIYKASTFVDESAAGLTTALANMIIMTFGYFFHTLIGSIVAAMGGIHESRALIVAISTIPIGLIAGTIGFIYLKKIETET